ncbi:MAG: FecR domain-containing protein [Dysgonamonadaceae bacterium]|jgi:ferric-dicitrate binding protein FerR (iron transport regulator)|nr:FecR domain-containing protein [Dysgonamonadaceae bacterium]
MDERIIKYFDGELSEDERIRLLRESEVNIALREELLEVQNVRGVFLFSADDAGQAEGERQYRCFMRLRRRTKLFRMGGRVASYAAAVALLIFITWQTTLLTIPKSTEQAVVRQELYTPAGQRARIILPDGSTAWLNAGSTLHYPSVFEGERRVSLTGEAFFDVAHDASKPFIVATGSLEITALGTQFNVSGYPDAEYMSASLVDGSIEIRTLGNPNKTLLKPNQQANYAKGQFRIEDLDKDQLLWKEGIYVFKGQSLEKIIGKLELYYDVEIVVTNPQILRYRYTGKFRQRDGAMEILRIIQKIHRFKIHRDEESNRITLS